MEEENTRKIVQEEINSYMTRKQYSYSKIPTHAHTGLDVTKIAQSDLIPSEKIRTFLISVFSKRL